MNNYLRNEIFYGMRALVRDNYIIRQMFSKELQLYESLSLEEINSLRLKLLHRTLQCAVKTLPFYSNIRNDFSSDSAVEVLQELFPIVDKIKFIENKSSLYPNQGKPMFWHSLGKTSGTTGTPLTIIRSLHSVFYENAFIKRHWLWCGYEDGMRRATLRGDIVVPLTQSKPPYWFSNRYNNQLLISSRHLNEHCITAILEELHDFKPYILQAYPSTVFTLAKFLSIRNLYLNIPFVFTASEPLYDHQRELIEERLNCKVMDMYGMAERVAFATECEFGNMHINPDYSFIEIVDDEGLQTNGYGYVVGTTFHNLAMPLVRYKLTDQTRWKPGLCECGRSFPMIEPVTGKLEDAIFSSDGSFISPSVLTFAFKGVENILKSQVAQISNGVLQIRLVPGELFCKDDHDKLINNIHTLVDSKINVNILLVNDIPNTSAGKFRWVVNETH